MTRLGLKAAVVEVVVFSFASLGLVAGCQSPGGSSAGSAAASPSSTGSTPAASGGSGAASASAATNPSAIEGVTCFDDDVVGSGTSVASLPPGLPTDPSGALSLGPTTILPTAPPAISGGTLLILPGDLTAVAADPDRDQIYIVDLGTDRVTNTIALQPGDEPGRVALDGAGRVEVALRGGGALVTLDPASGVILQRRAVCAAPRGLAYEAKTDLIHVACADGQLVSLPAAAGAPVRRIQLDDDLRDVVVDRDHLLVSRFRSAEILTLDATGALVARTQLGGFRSPDTRGGQLFTPAVAWRMVGMPGGGAAMMHQRGVDDPIQRGRAGHIVPGSYGRGTSPTNCDGIVHSAVSRMKADGTISAGPALADVPLPVDLAVSADGQQIAMVSAGNEGTTASAFGSRVTGAHVGDIDWVTANHTAKCLPDAGSTNCWRQVSGTYSCGPRLNLAGQLTAVAFLATGEIVTQSREPANLYVGDITIPLTSDSRADTGHKLFHFNAGAGLACASCHPEGGDDGRTWNFTCSGRRRTQSLQTGLRGTEPFHWDGDEKDFTQLSTDVLTGRMAGPQLMPDQASAILSWLDAQPRTKRAAPSDTAAVQRGQALFNRSIAGSSCATCHAGPHLTNNQTVDVGTGGPLQVPSLVGLANHPPFMHTGCAKTLLDRFTPACGGGDMHGVTSGLAPSELADLVSYLQTL
jgi:mono/diheme cytochrome c family protein